VQELPATMADATSRHVTGRLDWFNPVHILCMNSRDSLSVVPFTPLLSDSSSIDTLSV
jgi:hypothetical protein